VHRQIDLALEAVGRHEVADACSAARKPDRAEILSEKHGTRGDSACAESLGLDCRTGGCEGDGHVKYCDLRPAIAAYREGQNVTAALRKLLGEPNNTSQIIEIAYDLQAGSYIEAVTNHPAQWSAYTSQLSEMLGAHVEAGDRLLEVGTGEMTTLTGVANGCSGSILDHYAMDISWSRIARGREFVARNLRDDVAKRLQYFVGDLFHLPLRDKSMDVVWTSHAIEPNEGREKEALADYSVSPANELSCLSPPTRTIPLRVGSGWRRWAISKGYQTQSLQWAAASRVQSPSQL
jgi:hypothetical protein